MTHNNRGGIIERILDEFNLIMVTDEYPTRLGRPGDNPSYVDRTLATPDVAHLVTCYTLHDTYGSDHFPIVAEINIIILYRVTQKNSTIKKPIGSSTT